METKPAVATFGEQGLVEIIAVIGYYTFGLDDSQRVRDARQ